MYPSSGVGLKPLDVVAQVVAGSDPVEMVFHDDIAED
jgi:hypothetical protein